MDEIDFESDTFEDIVAKDGRYNARAYALLMDVIRYLGEGGKRMGGEDILEEFKERALDQYGPMTYTVLTEWGLRSCEDIGEMMFNLAEGRRVHKDESDTPEAFVGGYDFKEAFLGPYAI
ncbi:MAG: Minf_1886 family protein [Kiritimatiellia bacterium]